MKYIIGNWKANKNYAEVTTWLNIFTTFDYSLLKNEVEIIICPPFPFIPLVAEKIKSLSCLKSGSQDISSFPNGAYTGEIAAASLANLVDYIIIGHSERRKYFNETSVILEKKHQLALGQKITPIFCVRDAKDPIPDSARFIAYEPVHAIGTGNNESIVNVVSMRKKIKLPEGAKYIYGGSINEDNAHTYLQHKDIDGVLPGGASLNPESLYKIALAAL